MVAEDNRRASFYMVLGMGGFAVNDAFMKQVLGDMDLSHAIALRGLVASLFVTALAYQTGAFTNWKRHISPLYMIRLMLETATTYSFLNALRSMPLADANAILMVVPLAVTLGAAFIYGEEVGWRRYLAILIGFGGVLLVLQPKGGEWNAGYIYALMTLAFMVARDLLTRRLPSDMPSLLVAFGSATSITLVALILSGPLLITPVTGVQLIWLSSAGVFIFAGYIFVILAVRGGGFGAVAPFRYTGLVFAIALGWAMFNEFPSPLVLTGSGIIVASGLYSLWRERQLAKQQLSH